MRAPRNEIKLVLFLVSSLHAFADTNKVVILVRLFFWSRKLPCEMFPPHFSSLRCIGSLWAGRWTVIGSPSSSCQKSELIVAVFGFVVDRVSSRVTTGVFVFLDQRCSSAVSFTSLNSDLKVVCQAAARVFHFIEQKSLFATVLLIVCSLQTERIGFQLTVILFVLFV